MQNLRNHIQLFILILGPLVFLIILFTSEQSEYRVLGLVAWMLTWWIFEAVPIPITALLPLIVLPWLDIFSFTEAATHYANPVIYLFLGGFLLGLSIEKHNLHKRIALWIVYRLGMSKDRLLLGFMLTSGSLSMWISNTATTVMMLPIVLSVLAIIQPKHSSNRFTIILLLASAYAANIGGIATLIGTPTNLILIGYLQKELDIEISFLNWIVLALPISLSIATLSYLFLKSYCKKDLQDSTTSITAIRNYIVRERKKLGRISQAQWCIIAIFILIASAWIFKGFMNSLFHWKLTDSGIALFGGILLFALPYQRKNKKLQFLLEWSDSKKLAWGILLLFGGGLCIASALSTTGIIENIISLIPSNSHTFILLILTTGTALLLTELMSNLALISIYTPVLLLLSQSIGAEPLLLTVAATLAASCAFMLPISTPPNAIVFSSGKIRMKEMMFLGVWLNLLALTTICLICYTVFEIWKLDLQW